MAEYVTLKISRKLYEEIKKRVDGSHLAFHINILLIIRYLPSGLICS